MPPYIINSLDEVVVCVPSMPLAGLYGDIFCYGVSRHRACVRAVCVPDTRIPNPVLLTLRVHAWDCSLISAK